MGFKSQSCSQFPSSSNNIFASSTMASSSDLHRIDKSRSALEQSAIKTGFSGRPSFGTLGKRCACSGNALFKIAKMRPYEYAPLTWRLLLSAYNSPLAMTISMNQHTIWYRWPPALGHVNAFSVASAVSCTWVNIWRTRDFNFRYKQRYMFCPLTGDVSTGVCSRAWLMCFQRPYIKSANIISLIWAIGFHSNTTYANWLYPNPSVSPELAWAGRNTSPDTEPPGRSVACAPPWTATQAFPILSCHSLVNNPVSICFFNLHWWYVQYDVAGSSSTLDAMPLSHVVEFQSSSV